MVCNRTLVRKLISKILPGHRPSMLAKRVRENGLTYLNDQKIIRLEQTLKRVRRQHVRGFYLEFGVALGGSSVLIAKEAQKSQQPFIGFDVFGMIPEPASTKDDKKSRERYLEIARGDAIGLSGQEYYGYLDDLYERVQRVFLEYGIPVEPGRVELCKGLFEETLPKTRINSIAFAHVDCDWYDPVLYCLNFIASRLSREIASRLSRERAIIIDDYFNYGGARTATDEFILKNPEFHLELGANVLLTRR